MFPTVAFIGYGISVCAVTALVYFWQRTQSLQRILKEASARLDVARKQTYFLEENLAKAADKTERFRESSQKMEDAYDQVKSKLSSVQKTLDSHEAVALADVNRLELRLEHQTEQVRVLTEQLAASDRQRKELKTAHDSLVAESQVRVDNSEKEWTRRAKEQDQIRSRDLRDIHRRADAEISRLRQELATATAAQSAVAATALEMEDAKRKVAHYEKLYYGMKSLREMSDDRSKNWETALRTFSLFIIENGPRLSGLQVTGKREVNATAPLGNLIGEALEIAGGSLMENDSIDMEAIAQKVLGEPLDI